MNKFFLEDSQPMLESGGKMSYTLVSDNAGQIARIMERKEKSTMMMYQKIIVLICMVILGFLGYMTYNGMKHCLNFHCHK